MPRNGTGVYTLPAGNPVSAGTVIDPNWANTTLTDIGTALTGSIARDGQAVPTANIPMGSFKFTGLGAGSVPGDSIAYGQASVTLNDITTTVNLNVGGVLLTSLGAVGAPSHSFTGDTNTGMWSSGADTLDWSTNGTNYLRLGSTGQLLFPSISNFYIAANIGTGNPGVNFDSSDYLDYDRTNNVLRISAGAAISAQVNSTGLGINGTPISRLTVVSANTTGIGGGSWDNKWSVFGPNAGSTVGAAIAIGYDATADRGVISAVQPGTGWKKITVGTASFEVLVGTANISGLNVTTDGRVYGAALHNNAGSVTGTTNQYIASGTYTPTLTNGTNVTASTAYQCQWMRVGNVVTVSGKVDIDPNLTSTSTQLGISLPIASTTGSAQNLAGTAVGDNGSALANAAQILADTANNRANLAFWSSSTANAAWSFHFTYVVL